MRLKKMNEDYIKQGLERMAKRIENEQDRITSVMSKKRISSLDYKPAPCDGLDRRLQKSKEKLFMDMFANRDY